MDSKNNKNNKNSKNNRNLRGVLVLLAWAVVLTIGFNYFAAYTGNAANKATSFEVDFSALADLVREDKIARVEFEDSKIFATPIDGYVYTDNSGKTPKTYTNSEKTKVILYTTHINSTSFYELLDEHHVAYTAPVQEQMSPILQFMISYILPTILMLGAFLLVMRLLSRSSGGIGGIGSVGKSNAKVYMEKQTGVTFKDVAGQDEAKESLEEIIDFLHNPGKYTAIGAKLPKGALLVGSPGTGKTLLAKAVAGEANVPFFSISGSDFVEMFVGVGAARVRDLFDQAKKNSPAIIFIDELDAVGRRRFAGIGGGHDEREQTLNQLLIELDGFESKQGIILMASTNRPDVLDPALVRPGRFDRHVAVPAPDLKGREEILKVHAKKVKLSPQVNLHTVAKGTPGFVGADLANVINEAAILAARADKEAVDNTDMDEAVERVIAGPQKKSRIISDKEKKIIAAHEVGHTVVARLTRHSDPVHKVTIIPRGQALGYTLQLPLEDKFLTSKSEILDKVCILLAGRASEELVFGEITSGASDDLNKATAYARKMVMELGMSDKIGPIALPDGEEGEVFLGRDLSRHRQYSEDLARRIDAEIMDTLQAAYARAKEIISSHRAQFDALVARLMEKEVVEAAEIDEILGLAPQKKEESVGELSPHEEQPALQPQPAGGPKQDELF